MILFTTQNFLPDIGGQQAYVTGLADALAARGHALHVLADAAIAPGSKAVDSARAYPIARFGGPRPWRRFRKGLVLNATLDRGGVRAVVADSWKSLEHLRRRPDIPVLCLCHGSEFLAADDTKKRRIARALAKASMAAANSRYTAELVRRVAGTGTEVCVLLPGVEPAETAARVHARKAANAEPRLLTIARLEPRKGVDAVLKALPVLVGAFPGLVYDVAGDGADRARLARLAEALGVASAVRFHGNVGAEKKATLLAGTDLFVLPNRREPDSVEGFGLVFLEAAAFGVPSLAGADGGAVDAVRHGETGSVVSGADERAVCDAIGELLANPDRLREMGKAAHARFWGEFAWDAAVARFEAALGLAENAK